MNVRHDVEAFHYVDLPSANVDELNRLYDGLEAKGRERLLRDGISDDRVEIHRTAQMRYVGQTYEVDVDIPSGKLTDAHIAEIATAFHRAHEQEYGVSSEDFPVAFVALGVVATGALSKPPVFHFASKAGGAKSAARSRKVYFDGRWLDSTLKNASDIMPGEQIAGPAVIEYLDSIAVLPPGCDGTVDPHGNLIVSISN